MSAPARLRRRAQPPSEAEQAAAATTTRDLAPILTFERSARYRVRVIARERAGSRFVACIGEMLGNQNQWLPARAFNIRRDELEALIEGLQRAREILS